MYIKVHNQRTKWFRDDGTLVGKEQKDTDSFYNHTQHIIKTVDNKYVKAILGYFKDNSFVPLCMSYCNILKCKMYESDICYYSHYKDPTAGFYIYSD